jgi:opacity protein-like surface antigen
MKSFSLATTALAGAVGLALAGSAAAQPSSAPPDTVNWSGVYVGLNTGWNSANTQAGAGSATTQQLTGVSAGAGPVTVPPVTFPTRQMDYGTSGWAAGGQVGFNHQMGHFVVGLEGDMDAVNGNAFQSSRYQLPATALTTGPGTTTTIERFTAPQWTSTVRGRVGVAFGRALIYGTGGLAVADVRQASIYGYSPSVTNAVTLANPGTTFAGTSNFAGRDSTLTGWTVGGGAEWALNRGVSVGAEYRHSDYGKPTYEFGSTGPGDTSEAARLGFTDDQVLAKINFRFGPGGMF